MNRFRTIATAIVLIAPIGALAVASPASAGNSRDDAHSATIVTETNAATGNELVAYREANGTLTEVGRYSTGGLGSGNGLGSQSAIATSDHRVLAVDAGSNELSLFNIQRDGGLVLADVESTGGTRPISVTISGDTAYVLNGGDQTVTGFRIRHNQLVTIPGSHQSLPGSGAAQIAFDKDARRLVVTEKATNTIDVLPVRNGVAGAAVSNTSTGTTPFGFAIDGRNHVIVSNAAGGATSGASLSSYRFDGPAILEPIGPAVADTQTAACWVALSADGRFAFTTNAGSGSISSFAVSRDGTISLLQATALMPGAGPVDMAVDGNTLFTLTGGSHNITSASVSADGSLTTRHSVAVPVGVVGLAAI